jgi:hypothetical protein
VLESLGIRRAQSNYIDKNQLLVYQELIIKEWVA